MSEGQARFLTGSLSRHIATMSLTAAVGLLALFVVDLVDMVFISMLGVAELAAAVGFAGSILFMTTSVSIGFAIAGGALVARALGEGNPDRAREVLTHVLALGVIFAIGFAAVIFLNLPGLTALVGATGETQTLSIAYLRILIPTMPILMVGMIASAALRSHGAANLSMLVTVIGGVVNAVLDPILIFVLHMELEGAAWASVAARLSIAGSALWYITHRFGGLAGRSPTAIFKDTRTIAAFAVPAMLANIATPVGSAYVTRAASSFGEEAVAGMAVVGRLTPIAFALIFAMSGAIGPIIGQNFGAGQLDRVRDAFRRAIALCIAYVVPVVALLFLLRAPIADLFGAQGTTRDLIYLFCGPLSLAWVFNGVIFIANASYNNLGHPFYSTWVNWGRNTLGVVPFVAVGAALWGAAGVLIGQMAGGALMALVALWLAKRVMDQAATAPTEPPERPPFLAHRRAFTMLHHRR
ncbi:MATE family efflux transporter [Pseudooceanicola sp. 216_PA32_1]|uniref:MATE family efflux transporter n=1 Tax=Pseudooceanicola pacificus TaxID=2676438 RepID=A0A844WEC2_9RHOB|nr:MATE family efflux transporter [Pseudooceanicola pacificus]MWB79658.1 MATE family efflux transporter [Pseudooceanicola pacificus]